MSTDEQPPFDAVNTHSEIPPHCYVCGITLEEVGTLVGCYHCGQVLMCRSHIGGLLTVNKQVRAVCCVCLRLTDQ